MHDFNPARCVGAGFTPARLFGLAILLPLLLAILLLAASPIPAAAEDGIAWDWLKLDAKLTLAEKYNDNAYWQEKNPSSDYVTTVSPRFGLEFGLSREASLKLDYAGDYRAAGRFDNFDKDRHRIGLDGKWLAPGESSFTIGASANFDAIQPWSEQDAAKPYTDTAVRAEVLLRTSTAVDLGFGYNRHAMNYGDQQYARDEYTQQDVSANFRYKRFDPNVLFVGYTYLVVDARDAPEVDTGWQSHHVEAGIRWEPTFRLSGKLQGGYSLTSFEAGEEVSDYIVDTDLTYRVSEGLSLKLAVARKLGVSASAAREFGDYYVSTSGRFTADYHARESFVVTLGVSYENRTFSREDPTDPEQRTTKPFGAGLGVKYTPREWFSVALGYWHSQTTATLPVDEHEENIVDFRLSFSI